MNQTNLDIAVRDNIDSRAFKLDKIEVPAGSPLPHISRKALKRVRHRIDTQTTCQYCGSGVELVHNAAIYGTEYGDWPYAYRCTNVDGCGAHVGLHPDTDLPLGTLATKTVRSKRMSAKRQFRLLQDERGWSRSQAYAWLASAMHLPRTHCHFGFFVTAQCELAEQLCRHELNKEG